MIFALILVIAAILTGIQWRNRARAESLLRQVETIRVGGSTKSDVRRIFSGYPSEEFQALSSLCPHADSNLSVYVRSEFLNRISNALPQLRMIGLAPWGAGATVLFEQGKVCNFDYSFGAPLPDKSQELDVTLTGTLLEGEDSHVKFGSYWSRYSLVRGHIHSFKVHISPDAIPDERRKAFDFNLSCVSRVGGCRAICEVMPSALLDYQRTEGSRLPPEELNDPRCKHLAEQ